MPSCCYADEYGELFTDRAARRTARRFLRRGLRGSARTLADAVAATGIAGATILEVGGGVGQVHAELLRRGAGSATNVELSPSWEGAAGWMLGELGQRGRVQRRIGDFVDVCPELPEVDVVILHRVICCHPDWQGMVAAATSRSRRVVGITTPVDHWGLRIGVGLGNCLVRLQRRSFQAYVHPWDQVIGALESDGFRVVTDHRGLVWRTVVAERAAVSPP